MPNHVPAADTGLPASPLFKRRHVITALPVVVAGCAAPVLTQTGILQSGRQSQNSGFGELTRVERIQRHAEALLALIRPDLPDATTGMAVTVKSNWGPNADLHNRVSIDADALSIEWVVDERLRDGGLWTGKRLGLWSEGRFYA